MSAARLVQSAFRAITGNLLRAALTTLGIVIGVASVIAMLALGNGARASVESNFRFLGSDHVQIQAETRFDDGEVVPVGEKLTYEDGLRMAEELPLVEEVIMGVSRAAKIRNGRAVVDLPARGVTAGELVALPRSNDVQLADWPDGIPVTPASYLAGGRFFSPAEVISGADVCILGHRTAADLFEGEDPLEQVVWVNRRRCLVIGVLAELEVTNPALRNQLRPNEALYLPISTAIRQLFDEEPSIELTARVTDERQMSAARAQIADYLRTRHGIEPESDGHYEDDFRMTTRQDILGAQQEAARTFSLLLVAMAIISLVVGGIGIMNVMLVSVTERTREIGIRMAVGAQPRDIVLQFLFEAVMIGLFGGILGVAVGILSIPTAASFNRGIALLAPNSIPLALAVALLTGVLFGLYPAWRASRLDPIEALRHL